MGGGSSKASNFHCSVGGGMAAARRPRPDWLADPCSRVIGKAENFTNTTGIGKGKFGFVFLSRHNTSQKHIAIKYISKQFVHETHSLARLNQEIALLQLVDHPFIIHCFCGFDTPQCIALVFEFAYGGELFTYMKKNNRMPEAFARFYFCEIALALSYLQETLGILYRDLKPENVLLDYEGHVKLCDFGFAVQRAPEDSPLHDGCGTAMYVAPEIAGGFMKCAHSFPVDWWSLGCILAEMVTGKPPFGDTDSSSKFEVFNNTNHKPPNLPMGSCTSQLRNLLRGLLEKDPAKRFAWADVKRDAWLKDVSWTDLLNKAVTPPWVPQLKPMPTTDNFVSWKEMKLPSKAVDPAAISYTRAVELPKPRSASVKAPAITTTLDATQSSPSSKKVQRKMLAAVQSVENVVGRESSKDPRAASPVDDSTPDESKRSSSPNIMLGGADVGSPAPSLRKTMKKGMSIRANSSRKFGDL